MIKKLQKKFILVTMLSVVVVITIIMLLVNIMNFANIRKDVDHIIEVLMENNGRFPKPEPMENNRPGFREEGPFGGMGGNPISVETPYETRFFAVYVNDRGGIQWTNTGSVAAVSAGQAKEYALKAIDSEKKKGYIDDYRFGVSDRTEGKIVIFVDCQSRLNTARTFLGASVLISVGGVLAVLILVVVLSYRVMKPIADSYEKQKKFITNSSHELKTPMAVILANTEVLEITAGENEWTSSIKNQVGRLTNLTKNLTELARMDEETINEERQIFNLSDAVIDVVESFKVVAEGAKQSLDVQVEEGLKYNGNEKSIRQLVSILMDNAIKYSTGEIKVTLKKIKNRPKLSVYNTANNINANELEHYFDRFYRADESRSKEVEGFGIGLSIAKSIVELHNGKIRAKSDDGESIEFVVSL